MSRLMVVGACAVLALSSSAAQAQAPFEQHARFSAAPAPAGGQLERSLVGSARLGLSQPESPVAAAAREARAPLRAGLRHRGPGVALMLVGAAGVVTGLLLEESLITILGAGTGLVGLYLYLR